MISNRNKCVSLPLHILELKWTLGTLGSHVVGETALPKNSGLHLSRFLQTGISCLLEEEKRENRL